MMLPKVSVGGGLESYQCFSWLWNLKCVIAKICTIMRNLLGENSWIVYVKAIVINSLKVRQTEISKITR